MSSVQQELSVFNKFNFERTPVGVKFLTTRPDGIEKLDEILDFCEMLKKAQDEGRPFYATKEEFTCIGPLLLGMVEHDVIFESGLVGPELEVFKEPRANKKLYQFIPRLARGTVNYVCFSPLDKLTFEPDVLIITADSNQAEIILRANSYVSGDMWSGRGTMVAACAWLFVYPYVSGELNFTVTGWSLGMKSRRLFPDGLILLSIPWNLLPGIVANLQEMVWVPHSHTIGRDEHKKKVRKIVERLNQSLRAD